MGELHYQFESGGSLSIVDGDLLEQRVDVIVNAWNRNIIPWWLLLPQGVSGAIKRQAGLVPFRELGRAGAIPLGDAVQTSAGRLPYKAIIHVAGIDMLWRASEQSIRRSVESALRIAAQNGHKSLAFPVIGSGSGGFKVDHALQMMVGQIRGREPEQLVIVVRFSRRES